MYLDIWMQITVVVLFGCCAFFSYRTGETRGAISGSIETLNLLRRENVINIDNAGIITPVQVKQKKTPYKKKI